MKNKVEKKAVKSIRYNFIMNALLTLSSVAFPIITFPYISRVLSPDGVGKVYFANSIVSYFSMFSQLGIPTYGVRACAKVRDNRIELTRTVHEIFIINMVATIISYTVFFFSVALVPRLQQEKELFLVSSLSMMFNTIGMEWMYKGLEQYSYITKRFIFAKIIALIAMFALVRSSDDYIMYCAVSVFAGGASLVFNFIHARTNILFRYVGNYKFKQHLKPILIFFAMSCATTIYTNFDNVMLGFMQSDTDVGYYNAAIKIKSILISVVTSLSTVLLPRASYYVEKNLKNDFLKISRKSVNFVFLLATPLTVYFILYAKESILFLSGSEYLNAVSPMKVIMPTLLIAGLSNVMGMQILVPLGKEKMVLFSQIVGVITNIVINSTLIPKLSSVGAALGTLIAEIIVLVIQLNVVCKVLGNICREIHFFSIVAAVAVSGVISSCIGQIWENTFVVLATSAMSFFGVYILALTIYKEPLAIEIEKQVMKRFFRSGI